MDELEVKHRQMVKTIQEVGRVVVAFSGGVDSTLVLKVAIEAVGEGNVLAATGISPSLAQRERQSVEELAGRLRARLELVATSEMDSPQYTANPANRCYFCKTELYTKLAEVARLGGYRGVLNGLNADDVGDWRPGIQAAKEWAVRSPLLEVGMGKGEIRELARRLGLPNWEKPALACLSSRIPYGTAVTIEALSQIEKGEGFLWDRGFKNFRVRHHGKVARIEVEASDLKKLVEEPLRMELVTYFRNIGYAYVTVDLQGFRSGSGNEGIGSLRQV